MGAEWWEGKYGGSKGREKRGSLHLQNGIMENRKKNLKIRNK